MKRLTLTGLLVVFLILLGTTARPDDGTPYSVTPVDAAALVSGTSHPEPLPRMPSIQRFLMALGLAAVVVLALVANRDPMLVRRRRDDAVPAPLDVWSTRRVRRGPPTPA